MSRRGSPQPITPRRPPGARSAAFPRPPAGTSRAWPSFAPNKRSDSFRPKRAPHQGPALWGESVGAALGEYGGDRLGQDRDVEPDRPVVQVVEVVADEVVE